MPKKLVWFVVPLLLLVVFLLAPFLTGCRQEDNPVPPGAVHTGAADSDTGGSDTGAGSGNGTVTGTDTSQAAPVPAAAAAGETPGAPPAGSEAGLPGLPAANGVGSPGLPAAGGAAAPQTGPVTPHATDPDPAGQSPATSPDPAAFQAGESVTVQIAVIGQNGELLYGPGTVELPTSSPRGATALGALAATGLPYGVSSRFPDFVEAVAGLRNQGQSGWLYQVNGAVPPVSAAKKKLAAHDRVIWWYSKSINDPPPAWESLTRLP